MTSVNKLESIQKRGLKWTLGDNYSRSTISYSSNLSHVSDSLQPIEYITNKI